MRLFINNFKKISPFAVDESFSHQNFKMLNLSVYWDLPSKCMYIEAPVNFPTFFEMR